MSLGKFGAQVREKPVDSYGEKLIQFHQVYDPYFRKYFGCPEHGTDISECKPEQGVRDWKLEEELIKKAEIFTK